MHASKLLTFLMAVTTPLASPRTISDQRSAIRNDSPFPLLQADNPPASWPSHSHSTTTSVPGHSALLSQRDYIYGNTQIHERAGFCIVVSRLRFQSPIIASLIRVLINTAILENGNPWRIDLNNIAVELNRQIFGDTPRTSSSPH